MNEQARMLASIDAERDVLGNILQSESSLDVIAQANITGDSFYSQAHRHIWEAINALHERGDAITTVSVADYLASRQLLAHNDAEARRTGNITIQYLSSLRSEAFTDAKLLQHATLVSRKDILRGARAGCLELVDMIERGGDFFEIMNHVESFASALGDKQGESGDVGPVDMDLPVKEMFARIEEAYQSGDGITGVRTHLPILDEVLGGLKPSKLYILAARPAVGKSAMAINFVTQASILSDTPVTSLLFTLEMERSEIAERMAYNVGDLSGDKVSSGRMTEGEWAKFIKAAGEIKKAPVFIDHEGSLNINKLVRRARYIHRNHGLGLIVVDYLQLATSDQSSRELEIADIARKLKGLAKELKVPVVALAQLNRKCEERANKRPLNSDLRESGEIEQSADTIMMLYRDAVYDPETRWGQISEVNVTKNRGGSTGVVYAKFEGHKTRFVPASAEEVKVAKDAIASTTQKRSNI